MGDYLGTRNFHSYKKLDFRDYKSARKYVVGKKFKSISDWKKFCKEGKNPIDIPASPELAYKDTGWLSYSDFLGIEIINDQDLKKGYLPYKQAHKFVRSLKLGGQKEWRIYCQSGKKPKFIPGHPQIVYKKNGWVSLSEWLGNKNNKSYKKIAYKSFDDARRFTRKLKIKNLKEWNVYSKSKRPFDIPSNPQRRYKDKWKGWDDFLGKED